MQWYIHNIKIACYYVSINLSKTDVAMRLVDGIILDGLEAAEMALRDHGQTEGSLGAEAIHRPPESMAKCKFLHRNTGPN